MAAHGKPILDSSDRLESARPASPLFFVALLVGLGALVAAVAYGVATDSLRRFYFAYLVAYMFCLSIALGSLFFVLIQHLTRAGWSVNVRRPAEAIAATMPILAVLAIPILVSLFAHPAGQLYRWAQPADPHGPAHATADDTHEKQADEPHHSADASVSAQRAAPADPGSVQAAHESAHTADHTARSEAVIPPLDEITLAKRAWLNTPFFIARLAIYFAFWSLVGLWYWRTSTKQDQSGDPALTRKMETWAPLSMIGFAITLTLGSFDLVMSLDPVWYSTIFGVYVFAGSMIGAISVLTLTLMGLQRAGYLQKSVTVEHYHDLGKLLFAFVFFWGYIAFSQYMLIWYANMPETTGWFRVRGATTVTADLNNWTWVAVALLLGHLLIPFAGLLSRHVKRSRFGLAFWCVWMLAFHWLDLWWIIMPELGELKPPVLEGLCLLGVGGMFMAAALRKLGGNKLLAAGDPRIEESAAFQNI